jgi:hypothetical protein
LTPPRARVCLRAKLSAYGSLPELSARLLGAVLGLSLQVTAARAAGADGHARDVTYEGATRDITRDITRGVTLIEGMAPSPAARLHPRHPTDVTRVVTHPPARAPPLPPGRARRRRARSLRLFIPRSRCYARARRLTAGRARRRRPRRPAEAARASAAAASSRTPHAWPVRRASAAAAARARAPSSARRAGADPAFVFDTRRRARADWRTHWQTD